MNEHERERTIELLKGVVRPVEDGGLSGDLWPRMLRRMEEGPTRVPWFDWALAGLVVLWLLLFPGLIPRVLYHL
ncbi:MAG: hypothetical protein NTZ98_05525 [Acidobacteria bacterium]|jgi:hypothetical protein|nr:hypothetical protein [Acidobacteriota bacterium]